MFFCNYVLRSVKGLLGTYQKKSIVLTKKKIQLKRTFDSRVIVVSDFARKTLRKKCII